MLEPGGEPAGHPSRLEIVTSFANIMAPSPQMDTDPESSVELLERAKAGDSEALDRLLGRYLPRLRRWASGRLPHWARDLSDTEDLVQDTVVRTLRHIDGFHAQREGALQAYLRQAVMNRIRDELRRASRRRSAQGTGGRRAEPTGVSSRPGDRTGSDRAIRSRIGRASRRGARSDRRAHRTGVQLRGNGRHARQTDSECGPGGRSTSRRPARNEDETC